MVDGFAWGLCRDLSEPPTSDISLDWYLRDGAGSTCLCTRVDDFGVQILCRLDAGGIADFDAFINRFGFNDINDVNFLSWEDVDKIDGYVPVLVTIVAMLFETISDVDMSCAVGFGIVVQRDFVV